MNGTNPKWVQIWISLLFLHCYHFAIYFSVLFCVSWYCVQQPNKISIQQIFPFEIYRFFWGGDSFCSLLRIQLLCCCCCCCGCTKPTRHTPKFMCWVLNHVCQRKRTKKKPNLVCDITFSIVFIMQRHHYIYST